MSFEIDEILFAARELLFPTGISHAITGRITVVCSKYDERDEKQTAASRGGVRYARSRSTNDDTTRTMRRDRITLSFYIPRIITRPLFKRVLSFKINVREQAIITVPRRFPIPMAAGKQFPRLRTP